MHKEILYEFKDNSNEESYTQDIQLSKFIGKNYCKGTLWLNSKNWETGNCERTFKKLKTIAVQGLNFKQLTKSSQSQFQLCKHIQSINFSQLQTLDFKSNNIRSIELLSHLEMPKLKMLILSNNNITVLKSLRKLNAPQLNTIHLEKNYIIGFQGLEELHCQQLKRLVLDLNQQWYYQRQKDTLFKLKTPMLMKIEAKQKMCYYQVSMKQMKEIQIKIRSKLQNKFQKMTI